MSLVPIPGFIGPAYQADSKAIDCQECINLYPEVNQTDSKNVVALIGTPGFEKLVDKDFAGKCRALYTASNGDVYAVFGLIVYRFTSKTKYESIGNLQTASGAVRIVDNGPVNVLGGGQVFFSDGQYGYIYDTALDTFQRIVHEAFPGAGDVVFIDGYFVVFKPDTQELYQSEPYNGMEWDALKYSTADSIGDRIVRLISIGSGLVVVGGKSIEFWYNTGNSDGFSFSRNQSVFVDIGTDAPNSAVTNGSECFFLGSNARGHGIVWKLSGYNTEKISTHAIDQAISKFARIDDTVGYCYQQDGHFFYALNFLTNGKTFVYDLATGLWHERQGYKSETNLTYRHKITNHTYGFDSHIVADCEDRFLYEMRWNICEDDGETIRRVRSTAHVHANMKRIFINSVEIDYDSGVGDPIFESVENLDGLVCWVKCEGNANDSSKYKNNGTVYGAELTTNKNGAANSAYFFKRSEEDYISIQNSQNLNLSSAVSISCWFKISSNALKFEDLVMKGPLTYGIQFDESGTSPMFHLRVNGAWKNLDSGVAAVPGVWYHVLCSYDGATQCIYIDSQLAASVACSGLINTTTSPLDIGKKVEFDNNWFDGAISDVMVFNRALSYDEIWGVYLRAIPPQAMLSVSKNGGYTWGADKRRNMGRPGEYNKSLKWSGLGSGNNLVFKVTITDRVPVKLINAFMDVDIEA